MSTLKRVPRFGNVLRYLISFMLYNDGLAAIIAFGGVYAAATFGWSTVTLGIFGIILTVFAIPGAFLGGKLDDWIGSKRTVQFAIAGVIVATLGIVGVTATHILFVVPVDPISPTRGPVRVGAGEDPDGLRTAARLLHGADAGGQPHDGRAHRTAWHDR